MTYYLSNQFMVNKILLLHRVPSLKFVSLSVPKIRLIFGHGAKRSDLDLELVQNVSLGTDKLRDNFAVSASFRCRVTDKHASD